MFQLSEKAAHELKKVNAQVQEQQPGNTLRLIQSDEGGFKLAVGTTEEGDQELYCADEKVLVVDQETSKVLTGVTLDYKETPEGHRFVFEERAE